MFEKKIYVEFVVINFGVEIESESQSWLYSSEHYLKKIGTEKLSQVEVKWSYSSESDTKFFEVKWMFIKTLVYLKSGTRNCHISSTQEERRSKTGAHQ
jgi:hypothetical protein